MVTASPKTWKATTAGVLNIVAGGLNGLMTLGLLIAILAMGSIDITSYLAPADVPYVMPLIFPIMLGALVFSIITTVFPIIGGVYALKRKGWGWALAGSIIAIFGRTVLGILSTIFVAMAKDEFES